MTRNKESQELGLSENIPPNPLALTSLDDHVFVDQPDQPKNTNGDGSKPWYLLFTPSHSWVKMDVHPTIVMYL